MCTTCNDGRGCSKPLLNNAQSCILTRNWPVTTRMTANLVLEKIKLLKIKSIFPSFHCIYFQKYRPANWRHQFNLYKTTFSIKAHFLIWSYQACNNNDKLLTCMATNLQPNYFKKQPWLKMLAYKDQTVLLAEYIVLKE